MKDSTYIAVLLDRSGSMSTIKTDTIGGFNEFVKKQAEAGANATLTLVQFDTGGIDTVHENKPIRDVPELTTATYQPRGGTPLLDALGNTINSTGAALAAIPETSRPDKVVFVIITDGQENSSTKFTKAQIKEMIDVHSGTYKWNFIYLGANQDAFHEAGSVGIYAATSANFTPDNMRAAYAVSSDNLATYRATGSAGSLAYTNEQRSKLTADDDDEEQLKPSTTSNRPAYWKGR